MIIYDICCDNAHQFEGWFREANDYREQLENRLISCPVCGSLNVKKIPTASRIQVRRSAQPDPKIPVEASHESEETIAEFFGKLQEYVEKNYANVGEQFPEEARKVHYGETRARNIRGIANVSEISELMEEGISVTPLPFPVGNSKKLN